MNLTLVSADLVHRSGSFGEESKKNPESITNRRIRGEIDLEKKRKFKNPNPRPTAEPRTENTGGTYLSRPTPLAGVRCRTGGRHSPLRMRAGGPLCRTEVLPAATSTAARAGEAAAAAPPPSLAPAAAGVTVAPRAVGPDPEKGEGRGKKRKKGGSVALGRVGAASPRRRPPPAAPPLTAARKTGEEK